MPDPQIFIVSCSLDHLAETALILQLPDAGGPGHAAAEGDQHDGLAPLDAAFAPQLIETDADRAAGRVSVAVDIDVHLLVWQL